jgi:hypothetical protein
MSDNVDIPDIERIVFFTGQQLTAADLTALQTAGRELRWLHNRSLHAWGIGTGLAVSGEQGDSAVTITPGYGVDCLGREVLLTEARTRPVPAVASGPGGGEATYFLVAAYQANVDQQVAEQRAGVCLPEGAVRLTEEPLLDWRPPDALPEGQQLPLAQAWIKNCRLSRPLDLSVRRYARPPQQPYIAAGQTWQGATAWSPWQVGSQTVGVFTDVDTSAANFRGTPRYMAHIVGDRYSKQAGGLVLGIPAVVGATRQEFTLQVLLPQVPNTNPLALFNSPDIFQNELRWQVVWLGIEG